MRDDTIKKVQFKEIDLQDTFFDSLRESYQEFSDWFQKKADDNAFVMRNDSGNVVGFLYVKIETGRVVDIDPPLNTKKCLKVGTFKVVSHGTRVGERFVKKIFDVALVNGVTHCYVTVFEQHERLIEILKRYGFSEYGVKQTGNGKEKVFVKSFEILSGDIVRDYPVVNALGKNRWLLSIWPKWHTRLFPDSILRNESVSIIEDLSFTNSIHKVYISWMPDLSQLKAGDVIVVYRTAEDGRSAEYSSVATSVCVLQEIKTGSYFSTLQEFLDYCQKYSVFTKEELVSFYTNKKDGLYVLKMMYCVALPKRPTRHSLIEDAGISREQYFGLVNLGDEQFKKILELGACYEGLVID